LRPGCPKPSDLLHLALGGDSAHGDEALTRHIDACPRCPREIEKLRATVGVLRAPTLPEPTVPGPCLDEMDIAELVDGFDPGANRAAIAHLASCAPCRVQLATATQLIRDPSMVQEIENLESPTRRKRRHGQRISRLAMSAGLAAAALAGVLLWPQISHKSDANHGDTVILRERAITTTAAPRILGPVGPATPADSLRWTSVPRADLYRVTIWNREGTVVWEGRTRDTVLGLPDSIRHMRETPLLWDVKARTSWDRWVASDLAEFTVPGARRIQR